MDESSKPKAESGPRPVRYCAEHIDGWDEYWYAIALTVGRKSKDEHCPVGAVIVRDNIVLSTGFNGLPRHVYDAPEVLADAEEKLRWVCHAEQNAIFNAARLGVSLLGARIYVTKFPCVNCSGSIVQAGIRSVFTQDTKFWRNDPGDGKDVEDPHSRTPEILRQAAVKVDAPFHPHYQTKPAQAVAVSLVPEERKPTKRAPRQEKATAANGVKVEEA